MELWSRALSWAEQHDVDGARDVAGALLLITRGGTYIDRSQLERLWLRSIFESNLYTGKFFCTNQQSCRDLWIRSRYEMVLGSIENTSSDLEGQEKVKGGSSGGSEGSSEGNKGSGYDKYVDKGEGFQHRQSSCPCSYTLLYRHRRSNRPCRPR